MWGHHLLITAPEPPLEEVASKLLCIQYRSGIQVFYRKAIKISTDIQGQQADGGVAKLLLQQQVACAKLQLMSL